MFNLLVASQNLTGPDESCRMEGAPERKEFVEHWRTSIAFKLRAVWFGAKEALVSCELHLWFGELKPKPSPALKDP